MSEIGEMLTKEDTYLWSENDIFGYTITFSLKFEDFDELIFLNSFAPSFSTYFQSSFGVLFVKLMLCSFFLIENGLMKTFTKDY